MAHYHCSIKSGSRSSGKSASAKADYISRDGKYEDRQDLAYVESGNMPAWASEDSKNYWKAADDHERANGTLYHEIEFALPNDIPLERAKNLATTITSTLTTNDDGSKLPYTLAIHDKEGNRHCHLMISGRKNDLTNDRTPETWFKRSPIGAEKVDLYNKEFLHEARLTVEVMTNAMFKKLGMDQEVSSKSYKDQGINKAPQIHLGPAALRYEQQTGQKSERRKRSEKGVSQGVNQIKTDQRIIVGQNASVDDYKTPGNARMAEIRMQMNKDAIDRFAKKPDGPDKGPGLTR